MGNYFKIKGESEEFFMPQIKNYMEELVYGQLDDVLEDISMCKCNKCKMDVAAIALNDLPPKYIVTEMGEIYSKLNILSQQFEVNVVSAITKAAILVKRRPRHE
jgi:competence protein ComFB